MKNITEIIIYTPKIPKSYYQAVTNSLSKKIDIKVCNDAEQFLINKKNSHLMIVQEDYYKLVKDDAIPKIIIMSESNKRFIENNEIMFDAYRNEDKAKVDLDNCVNTFIATVIDTIEIFRIPTTPDDDYQPVVLIN